MKQEFDRLHVVLVEPKNPGNIGSVARAMKNMGVHNLRLVNPVDFRDNVEQKKLGYQSQDIIKRSREYTSLSEALSDISLVFLATSKKGKWKRDFLSPSQAAGQIVPRLPKEKVAVVFGREDSGVTIDESQLANGFIVIPSAISYPSLNLSQAVMVIVYEIFKTYMGVSVEPTYPKMAEKKSFLRLVDNIWNLMQDLEMREDDNGLFHRSLRRAINRTRWTNADIAVFDRACKQMRWYMENKNPRETS